MIKDRNLKAGTKLVAKYKGQEYVAEVIDGEGGKVVFWMDGKTYKSISALGVGVLGPGKTCDGWRFWSVKGEAPTGEQTEEMKAETKSKKNAKVEIELGEHIDCICPLIEPDENGICKKEVDLQCMPA